MDGESSRRFYMLYYNITLQFLTDYLMNNDDSSLPGFDEIVSTKPRPIDNPVMDRVSHLLVIVINIL
jgi:hypothetical protein